MSEKKIYTAVLCNPETGKTKTLIGVYTKVSIMVEKFLKGNFDLKNSYLIGKRKKVNVTNLNLNKEFNALGHVTIFKDDEPYIKILKHHLNEDWTK